MRTRTTTRLHLRPLAVLLACLALLAPACGSAGSDQPGQSGNAITIGEQGTAAGASGLWPRLADDLGYLREEGLTVQRYVSATKGADAINGMVSGEIQISLIGPEGIVASSKGADVVGIGAYFDRSVWGVVAAPGVTDWSQLKGKTVALGSLSDITRVVFDQLATGAGLNPATDLTYVALGATPARVSAVQNGQAAATIATYPEFAKIAKAGLNDLGFAAPGAQPPALIATEIEASREWAEANPDAATGFLRAIDRTAAWVRDPANRPDAIDRISRLMDEPDTEAIAEMLDFYFPADGTASSYLPAGLRHDPQTFDRTVEAYQQLGLLTRPVAEPDYMDYSYADKAVTDRG